MRNRLPATMLRLRFTIAGEKVVLLIRRGRETSDCRAYRNSSDTPEERTIYVLYVSGGLQDD